MNFYTTVPIVFCEMRNIGSKISSQIQRYFSTNDKVRIESSTRIPVYSILFEKMGNRFRI